MPLDAYIGTIMLFGGDYEPAGWMFCNGQTLAISEYDALFALIGTTYGGNGQTTFALPDLRGRAPVHFGSTSYQMGQKGGIESVTLTTAQMPAHSHVAMTSRGGSASADPAGRLLRAGATTMYTNRNANPVSMGATALMQTGGGAAHNNMQPFLVLNYVIAVQGIFPSPN